MKTNASHLLLTGVLAVAVFASSSFVILQSSIPNEQSAFATFPGENGKIAFTSTRDGNREIYVMNADGSEQTRLTFSPFFDHQPDWSPDGTKIVFTSERDLTSGAIYVMNADGTNQIRLTDSSGFDFTPSWSPDGTKIAFASSRNNDDTDIYVMNADGTNHIRLTDNDPEYEFHPRWSPDGTKIAYTARDVNNIESVYVMNADGTEQTRLTTDPGYEDRPDWGPATDDEPPADTTAPVITVPDDMTLEATGPDGAEVSFEPEPSATDDVDGPVDVTCDHNSGDTFPIGETVVTCNAEDEAGNSAEETFTVTVKDTTDPEVEITEVVDRRNRVLEEGDTTPTPYVRVTFEATDAVGVEDTECNLDGQGFTSCTSPVVYDRLSRGTHEVTVRATDEAGNIGEDQFLFTVGSPPTSNASPPGRQS